MTNEPAATHAAPHRMAAMDSLPPELRRALHEAAHQWCPAQVARRFKRQTKNAPREIVIRRLIAGIVANERAMIAGTAHEAAGASVMRYDARKSRSSEKPA